MKGEVPRSRICEVVTELVDTYEDATVKAFIPILIRRKTIELLKAEREIVISDVLVEQRNSLSVYQRTNKSHVDRALNFGEDRMQTGEI